MKAKMKSENSHACAKATLQRTKHTVAPVFIFWRFFWRFSVIWRVSGIPWPASSLYRHSLLPCCFLWSHLFQLTLHLISKCFLIYWPHRVFYSVTPWLGNIHSNIICVANVMMTFRTCFLFNQSELCDQLKATLHLKVSRSNVNGFWLTLSIIVWQLLQTRKY